ncbi:MAG TPA: uroporphyrinogen decarboxylase [Gammaproteobacteria bacterium]|nr:uroporphyrinogen decarboxylase [Gammaproteobacteria bacterium]
MTDLKNHCFIRAIRQEPVDRTPIWIMRQAGRYLPEYREVRKRAGSFLTVCKTPELASEVTLQPLRRFALDAAILFSDILTIPDAMGLGLRFTEGEGPVFDRPIRSIRDVAALGVPDPDIELRYVLDAIRLIQHELDGSVPLIGFCGSPFTLATYMLEGRANKEFPMVKAVLREDPALLHALLDTLAQSVALHLNAQIRAGVEAVMIFDTWGGMLETKHYQEYSLRYIRQVISLLARDQQGEKIPLILFTKNGGQWLEQMAEVDCQVLAVDWQVHLGDARRRLNGKVALQGNMDPDTLLRTPEEIEAEVARILAEFGHGSGHIFNLGHGITPDVPPEHVTVLVNAVHTLSRPYHEST